jgi:hypothetical protein
MGSPRCRIVPTQATGIVTQAGAAIIVNGIVGKFAGNGISTYGSTPCHWSACTRAATACAASAPTGPAYCAASSPSTTPIAA